VANDVGYPINTQIVEGQMEGGITMGFGRALTEDDRVDEGKLLVTDLVDYFLWRATDVPDIEPIIVTTNDPYGPFGAKGVGELGLVATAGMVANAIYHATGVRIKELPMTPESILRAIKEKKRE
jgi:xanthine dehydrogenase molybdenum-binding subunit